MSESVFNEVLTIGIDTGAFNAQIEAAVAKYSAAMEKMGAAGSNVGNFGAAAGQINQLSAAADAGAKSFGSFGDALESAAIRVPARLLVFAAIGAAIAAIAEPIKLVSEGFKALEDSSEGAGLRESVESLEVMKTHFEELSALPLFDAVTKGLGEMNRWLIENKDKVDSLVYAFGGLIKAILQPFFDAFKTDGSQISSFFQGLMLEGTAFGYVVASLTALLKLMVATVLDLGHSLGQIDFTHGLQKFGESFKGALDVLKRDMAADWADYQKEAGQNITAAFNAGDAIMGHGPKAPNVAAPSTDTKAELDSELREKIAAKKAETQAQLAKLKEDKHNDTINAQQESAQAIVFLEAEKKAVIELGEAYKKKAADAILAHSKGDYKADAAAIAAENSKIDREVISVTGSAQGSANNSETSYRDAAADERKRMRNADLEERLAMQKQNNAALQKENDDAYRKSLETIDIYYAKKKALNDKAFGDEEFAILDHQKNFAPGTEGFEKDRLKIGDVGNRAVIAAGENDQNRDDAKRQATIAFNEQAVAMKQASVAQEEITARSLEETGNHKQSLKLLQDILVVKREIAQLEFAAAVKEAAYVAPGTPAYAAAQVKVVNAQTAVGVADLAIAKGEGDKAAAANPLMAHTAALNAEIQALNGLKNSSEAAANQLSNLESAGQKFAAALKDVNQIAGELKNGVSDYIQGAGRGHSVLGGAGAVLSDSSITGKDGLVTGLAEKLPGMLGDSLGKMVPMIGPLIGTMFSTVSQLLSAGVQRMVDEINNKIQAIQTQASSGQIGIGQEIIELQQAKQQAINELGGSKKKGAQDQLNAILKTLNAQIGSLMFQQQQIIQNFNNMTKAGGLDTLSGTFASWYQTWDGINSQVKAYVDAGGSIATANQYLNQQLEIQRQTLTTQLTQGDQTALQDAVALNQLLTQRSEIMKEEAKTEFGIINSDSIERRTSAAVAAGSQLQQQRYAFSQQMIQMNEQITLDQQRLSVEGKIFDVAGNLQTLYSKMNTDNISALNIQLAQYKDMQTILNSTNGLKFSGPISNSPTANLPIPGEPSVAGAITIQQIVVNGKMSAAEANTIGTEIGRGIRSGRASIALSTS